MGQGSCFFLFSPSIVWHESRCVKWRRPAKNRRQYQKCPRQQPVQTRLQRSQAFKLQKPVSPETLPGIPGPTMTHNCILVLGKTALMASLKPERPSLQAIKMSSTPLFLRSLQTSSQKLALSCSPIQMPGISFWPFMLMASTL